MSKLNPLHSAMRGKKSGDAGCSIYDPVGADSSKQGEHPNSVRRSKHRSFASTTLAGSPGRPSVTATGGASRDGHQGVALGTRDANEQLGEEPPASLGQAAPRGKRPVLPGTV